MMEATSRDYWDRFILVDKGAILAQNRSKQIDICDIWELLQIATRETRTIKDGNAYLYSTILSKLVKWIRWIYPELLFVLAWVIRGEDSCNTG